VAESKLVAFTSVAFGYGFYDLFVFLLVLILASSDGELAIVQHVRPPVLIVFPSDSL